jgi:SH3-like domain-containing protein
MRAVTMNSIRLAALGAALLLAVAARAEPSDGAPALRPVARPAALALPAAAPPPPAPAEPADGLPAEEAATSGLPAPPDAAGDREGGTAPAALLAAVPAEAAPREDPEPAADAGLPDRCGRPPEGLRLGPVTCLPLPRFVSLKAGEGNVRRGPSLSHRIDWVFVRQGMPLQITAEYGHWRRVVDREGLGGWVHYSLLSGVRTAIVDTDLAPLRARPDAAAPEVALLEAGVIARIDRCELAWCRISAGGYRGWVPKTAIWGVGADEILD